MVTQSEEEKNSVRSLEETKPTRRDFIVLTAAGLSAVGLGSALWPFISSMNPAADVLALSSTEVSLKPIQPGQSLKVMYRGKPVFVRRRTKTEIDEARDVKMSDLPDPQEDSARVLPGKEEWLVVIGVCTHLGCIPIDKAGAYGGWFCPCHGSHYDTSGRIRRGPAPLNLHVPPYKFTNDSTILIG